MQKVMDYVRFSRGADPVLALRGLAALAIILFHLRPPTKWLYINGINLSFLTAPVGAVSVYIFYLLSGYVIGFGFFSGRYRMTRASLRSYYINRFLRIAPAYYLNILLCIYVFFPSVRVTAFDVFRFFTFTANIDYFSLPFQQLLSIISTEMQFYLLAPFLYLAIVAVTKRIPTLLVGFGILATGILIRYGFAVTGMVTDLPTYMYHLYVTVWGMSDYFLIGMLISHIVLQRKERAARFVRHIPDVLFYALALASVVSVNYFHFYPHDWSLYGAVHMYMLPAIISAVVGFFLVRTEFQHPYRAPGNRNILVLLTHPKTVLTAAGTLSYGLYLYHFAFFDVIYRQKNIVTDSLPSYLARVTVIMGVSTIAALVSYALIERPLRTHFGATNGVFVKPESRSSTEGEEMAEA